MNGQRLDVVEILEREKEYYLEQIKRINVALSALRDENTQNVVEKTRVVHKGKNKVSWTQEITNLFRDNIELSKREIQQKLVENGIIEAEEIKGKNAINTTLKRMIDKGSLVLNENRNYQKRGYARRRLVLSETNDENEDATQVSNQ